MSIKHHESSWGRIAYEKRGLGDPLLLVHGIYPGASHDEYRRNIDALAKSFTVYAIDLLGFGDSDMPRMTYTSQIYQNLLREFIVEVIGLRTHIMACEESCGPAVALAVYNDDLIDKLILIDPELEHSQPASPHNAAAKVQQFLLGTLSLGQGLYEAVSSEFEIRRFLLSRYANTRRLEPARVKELHERALRRHALHTFISHITGHLAMDIPRWLRSVRSEVLVLWGERTGAVPTEKLLQPAAWSKGKRIEVVPDSAHWPHDEQSAKVNRIVLEFLNRTENQMSNEGEKSGHRHSPFGNS